MFSINFLAYHKIDNKLIENKMIVYPDDYLDDIDNKQTCRYYELYSFNDNNFEIIFNEDLNINNEKDLIDLIKQIKENTIEQINWDYPCFYYHLDLDQN